MNVESTQTTETTGTPTQAPAKTPRKRAAKPAAKRTTGKQAKPAAKAAKPAKLVKAGPDGTPLKSLLAELDLPADGRAARRKLRAAKFEWHDPKSRWNLNAKQLKQAREILAGDAE